MKFGPGKKLVFPDGTVAKFDFRMSLGCWCINDYDEKVFYFNNDLEAMLEAGVVVERDNARSS